MATKLLIGLLVVLNAGLVSAMSSSNYTISISDFNHGGGYRASGQYRIDDVVGQKMIGDMSSTDYNLSVGLIPVLLPQSGISTSTPTFVLNNDNVKVYPNPYKKNNPSFSNPEGCVYFKDVSQDAVIKIYTIAGELVKEINATEARPFWDVNNIASGVYIYVVTGGLGGKSVGKIGITKWE